MEDEILRSALEPGADCLSVEDLGKYRDGGLDAAARAACAAHLEHCVTCQAELALLEAVTSAPVQYEPTEIVAPTPRRWFDIRPFPLVAAAAAMVIGVAAGGVYLLTMNQAPTLPGRVDTRGEVTRSLAIAVRRPLGEVDEAPQRFEWHAVDGAARYQARLFAVDRTELWSVSTAAAEVDLPDRVRASFVPGRTFAWDVMAYDASGAVIAESGSQSFRIRSR
jgi:hypothetical protein